MSSIDLDEDDNYTIPTIEEYRIVVLRLESLEALADRIADRWSRQGTTITKFGVDAVYYTYNGSCNCHPEEYSGEFPARLLFDPEWEAKIQARDDEAARVEAEKAQAVLAAKEQKRLRDELNAYERLKRKFEGGGEATSG